ncbi:MAG: HNH endonuclease [Candidatus Eremiobacteraeota bacterium]|nr:HNH endonuclease [Candidatus Eremiobacteraeota bacterium]
MSDDEVCARENCANPIKRNATLYCSLKCQCTDRYERYIAQWLAGEISGTRSNGDYPSNHIRGYLMETAAFECSMCGWGERNPHTGRIPLHVDHIDGNAQNNRPENLRLLCPNHHALTESYAGANRGNGRPNRRARYKRVFSPLIVPGFKAA